MRVQHTINISAKMPRSFVVQTPKETKVLAYVQVGASAGPVIGGLPWEACQQDCASGSMLH